MKIRWIGHAAFYVETRDGLRIRTDPYDKSVGLPISNLPADVVTVSHEHFDHNATDLVQGNPQVLRGEGRWTVRGAEFRGVATFHDESKGAKRGKNTVFVITADGITLVHLGDLGHVLTDSQVKDIGPVAVLCIPVGGTYTIDAAAATALIASMRPSAAIPMHYQVPGLRVNVASVDAFLKGKPNVRRLDELSIDQQTLPTPAQIVVLAPRP